VPLFCFLETARWIIHPYVAPAAAAGLGVAFAIGAMEWSSVVSAFLWNRLVLRRPWPLRWL